MKKCCKEFLDSIVEFYKDRSFEWQCPTCGKLNRIITSADAGLNYYGQTPDEVVSNKIIINAIEGKYGEKVQKQALNLIKKAAKRGKNIKIKLYDRFHDKKVCSN